jgi:Ca2+-binding EF-hand superfamily protein
VGDCDGDGTVAINELLIGVNIVTGTAPVSACRVLDQNGDGGVTVNELVRAVNNALNGCPRASASPSGRVDRPWRE